MWTNWVAAFGVLIEFLGFGTLAYELMKTNKSTILETVDLAGEQIDIETIVFSKAEHPGETSGGAIKGGIVGKLIEGMRARENELRIRTGLIVRGVVISAIGCALQVIGSFGQALQPPL
jgi:hypothetical protein